MQRPNFDLGHLRRQAHYGLAFLLLVGTIVSVLLAGAASYGIESLPLNEDCFVKFCSRSTLGNGSTSIIGTLVGFAAVPTWAWVWSNVGLFRRRDILAHIQSEPVENYIRENVEYLAGRLGIPTPRVAVVADPNPNAYAIGNSPANAAVILTTGLLRVTYNDERALAAIIGHELGHIASGDMRAMEWASSWQNALVWYVGYWQRARRGMRKLVLFISELAAMKHSRDREYWADAVGAALVDPHSMIRALKLIHGEFPTELPHSNAPERQFYWPGGHLFSTHPSLQQRVTALEQHAYINQLRPAATTTRRSIASFSPEQHLVPIMLLAGLYRYTVVAPYIARGHSNSILPLAFVLKAETIAIWALVAGFIWFILTMPWKPNPMSERISAPETLIGWTGPVEEHRIATPAPKVRTPNLQLNNPKPRVSLGEHLSELGDLLLMLAIGLLLYIFSEFPEKVAKAIRTLRSGRTKTSKPNPAAFKPTTPSPMHGGSYGVYELPPRRQK